MQLIAYSNCACFFNCFEREKIYFIKGNDSTVSSKEIQTIK